MGYAPLVLAGIIHTVPAALVLAEITYQWTDGPGDGACAQASAARMNLLMTHYGLLPSHAENSLAMSRFAEGLARQRPGGRHYRPISARSHGVVSLRACVTILVRRLESRSRQLREAPSGRVRRNISSTC